MRILNHKKNKIMRKIPFEYRRSVFFEKKTFEIIQDFKPRKKILNRESDPYLSFSSPWRRQGY